MDLLSILIMFGVLEGIVLLILYFINENMYDNFIAGTYIINGIIVLFLNTFVSIVMGLICIFIGLFIFHDIKKSKK